MKIIDRYLIREFLKTMLLALVSFALLFILVDVFEKLDIFIDAKAKLWMVALFYLYQIPYILVLTLPVAMLLASMGTISQMSRNYEIVALKSSGVSLNRIFLPLLLLGLLVSLMALGFGETVVPYTNQKRGNLERQDIRKRSLYFESIRTNLYYAGTGGRFYFIKKYDVPQAAMDSVVIWQLDAQNRLAVRVDAPRGLWVNDHWELQGIKGAPIIRRQFINDQMQEDSLQFLALTGFQETPESFTKRVLLPDEMNFAQLARYIDALRRSGGDAHRYVVDLYFKLSFPFANFIILLFGLPILSNARKSGATLSFSLSLLVCFVFWGILQTGRALGHNASLMPGLAAWLPNLIFGALGLYILYRAPK
ncbi:LPS export ABC transporter permease LptG [candidate division TA06 bacterium]|uniref:LPS export ABC transporter permease LptG n=1 Tax=candidate division TA06 bacterium TaxID=2250710 RepID=A0A933IBT3_UNCT6|nr:LPS export ABC transporter permease LptG [candidate division TA06 bacterium]